MSSGHCHKKSPKQYTLETTDSDNEGQLTQKWPGHILIQIKAIQIKASVNL